jgi:hypothetical protein
MTRLISRIYDLANAAPPRGVEAEERNHAARREAWQRHGLAVLDPEDIADDWLRLAIRNEADRRFGRRKGRGA